jgi:biotin synthase
MAALTVRQLQYLSVTERHQHRICLFGGARMSSNIDGKALKILEKGRNGVALSKEDCRYLLKFNESSPESTMTRAVANDFTRKRLNNAGVIIGQIGVDIGPCVGGCKFCTFAEQQTKSEKFTISDEELVRKIKELSEHGDLYGLFLMTMHVYDKDMLLHMIDVAKKHLPKKTQLWINVGDTDYDTAVELKQAGVRGVYHVCRLREGVDTNLRPEDRMQTMKNMLRAGLELYTCCEPVGPEHSVEEIVDNFFIGIDMGCIQHACMRRVAVNGTHFEKYGQITELRLAQLCAVLSLTAPQVEGFKFMSVHEPNQAGFISGANLITAESGGNPRDTKKDTRENRGWTMGDCRKMLWESGFTSLRLGDEGLIPLTLEYLEKTDSK